MLWFQTISSGRLIFVCFLHSILLYSHPQHSFYTSVFTATTTNSNAISEQQKRGNIQNMELRSNTKKYSSIISNRVYTVQLYLEIPKNSVITRAVFSHYFLIVFWQTLVSSQRFEKLNYFYQIKWRFEKQMTFVTLFLKLARHKSI